MSSLCIYSAESSKEKEEKGVCKLLTGSEFLLGFGFVLQKRHCVTLAPAPLRAGAITDNSSTSTALLASMTAGSRPQVLCRKRSARLPSFCPVLTL